MYSVLYVLQSNLAIRNFLVTAKLFRKVKCSLLPIVHYQYHIGHQFIPDLAQDPPKLFLVGNNTYVIKNQDKVASFLQSIIGLVPKGFHIMHGSRILWALFSVTSQNWSKKFLKSPFLLIFTISCSLTPSFGIFLIGKSSLSNSRFMV